MTRDMDEFGRITSRDNRRLIDLRKVRDGKDRSLIFIEGIRLVEEAVLSGIDISSCFVSDRFESWNRYPGLRARATAVADQVFSSISDTANSQGILLTAKRPIHHLEKVADRLKSGPAVPVVVYLSAVNNPSNLGAVIRTAEAAGALAVMTSPGSADAFSPKALRASMGSAFRLPVISEITLEAASGWADEAGLAMTAADIRGERAYSELDWRQPRILMIGSEAHGLGAGELGRAEEVIVIPMDDPVESINLAVSVGVILFEARRQNGR